MIQHHALAKTLGVVAVVLIILLAWGAMASGAGYLDGRTFTGETGEKGKAKGNPETFVFKDKTFDPLDCHRYGFSAAPYTTREEGGRVRFEAETKSDKEGSMRWQGAVQGDTLAGTMVWTKAGQKPIEYWFKGKLKK
jgi:hypothetical protein